MTCYIYSWHQLEFTKQIYTKCQFLHHTQNSLFHFWHTNDLVMSSEWCLSYKYSNNPIQSDTIFALRCVQNTTFMFSQETGSTHLWIINVVNLIKYDILKIADHFTTTVQHGAENFCGHNQTLSSLVDLEISSNKTHISKSFFEVTVLLIWECLNWRCINGSETDIKIQATIQS